VQASTSDKAFEVKTQRSIACRVQARGPMRQLPLSCCALCSPLLALLIISSSLPRCSGQTEGGIAEQVRIVTTPEELFSAVNDEGARHIVIQAHMNFSETGNLKTPLLQLQLSTKSIQVCACCCGQAGMLPLGSEPPEAYLQIGQSLAVCHAPKYASTSPVMLPRAQSTFWY
jgi:hypothetical protein